MVQRPKLLWLAPLLVAACQVTPPSGGAPATPTPPAGTPSASTPAPAVTPGAGSETPAPGTSASPGGSAPPATPVPTATPLETVVGLVMNDQGGQVEQAEVTVDSDDPNFRRALPAAGGAFSLRDVPVGTTLTFTATAPGYTRRQRAIKVQAVAPDAFDNPNRVEFGGRDEGMFYYLSRTPEIGAVTPPNRSTGVKTPPLSVAFTLSHPIRKDDQPKFDRLLRIVVPVRAGEKATAGEATLQVGTAWNTARATMAWNVEGTQATFTFPAPILMQDETAAVSVGFDQTAPLADWPKDVNGRTLGLGVTPETQDGAGTVVRSRIAPFAFPETPNKRPIELPEALKLWGLAHSTTARFTLARDTTPLEVLKVVPAHGLSGNDDLFILTFNKPVHGYPEDALKADSSREVARQSNYHYVLGSKSTADERIGFEQADPARGTTPTLPTTFDAADPHKVLLHISGGTLVRYRYFKFYADPEIEDVYGVKLGTGKAFEGEIP